MPDHPLPPIVYLPSSGGYTSSRIVPETPDRQRFPFRRYSIDDDGKLVCKTRNVARDTRLKPYDRPPSKPVPFPPRRSPTPTVTGGGSGSSGSDAAAQLLANLVPTIMRDPKPLESVSSICATHNVDSTIVASLIRAVKGQLEPPEGETLNESSQPAVQPETSSSKPSDTRTSPLQDGLIPFKQQRPFASGSSGSTIWYTSQSHEDIIAPSDDLNPNVGDLYVHNNRDADRHDVWLFEFAKKWRNVTNVAKVYHPIIPDRVLNIRANGTPSWITSASFTTIKGRKEKSKAWD